MKDISGVKIFCMALAALMLSLILIPAGFAAIGVEEGDWAKYKIEAEIPVQMGEEMEMMEEIEWMKLEVKSVVGTTVTLEATVHLKNGTEGPVPEDGPLIGFVIEADLGEGDEVNVPFAGPEGAVIMKINGTKSRTYTGASREVNYVDITVPEASLKAYWDKATGFLCELSLSANVPAEFSMSLKMTETNLWEAGLLSEQWLWILAVVIIAAVVAAGSAFLLLRRRKAPLPEVAPTPTE